MDLFYKLAFHLLTQFCLSFLKILMEKADELGGDVSSITRALVSGEALPPSLRDWFAERGVALNAQDPEHLVLFPEMDVASDVAEITSACWGILGVNPNNMMCATSRMVVRRKGAAEPAVPPGVPVPSRSRW